MQVRSFLINRTKKGKAPCRGLAHIKREHRGSGSTQDVPARPEEEGGLAAFAFNGHGLLFPFA